MSSIWKVRPASARRVRFATICAVRSATMSWTRRETAALLPSTARNALVSATAIFEESNGDTDPSRRMTWYAGSLDGGGAAANEGERTTRATDVVSVPRDIGPAPRGVVGRGRADARAGVGRRTPRSCQATHRDTPPGDVLVVAAGLLARGSQRPSGLPEALRPSDTQWTSARRLQLRGQRRPCPKAAPASLLALDFAIRENRDYHI